MKQATNPFGNGCGWLLVGVLVAVAGARPAGAADGERALGTIGPAARKNPQRETAAEGLGPSILLTMPSVTLRRSEPKAEPQAPLFAGKLTYGTYQDYMPNPGDLDNLMRHVRGHVGLWYGQRLVTIEEVVAGSQAGKPCRIPLLYVTGYHPVTWADEQRAALADYVVRGGALLGDATLGSPAFTESLIREVRDRQTGLVRPLELLGLRVNDRLAVVYSPNDTITDLKQVSDPFGNGYDAASCRQVAVNIVAYAMQN